MRVRSDRGVHLQRTSESLPLFLSCLLNGTSVQAVHPPTSSHQGKSPHITYLPGTQSQGGPAQDLGPALLEAAMSDHAGETL